MRTALLAPALLGLSALAFPAPLAARPAPTPPTGMVSASDPRAAAAGLEMLKAGGSATDAAIATMLALGVVEPQNSGIGGGLFWVRHSAGTPDGKGRFDTIDGRETAPKAADGRWFYGDTGQPLSHSDAVPGGRSVGIPGALRAMAAAHRTGGKLPWARLFAPAIRLAGDGFQMTPRLVNGLNNYGSHVDVWARAHFFGADGKALPVGTLLRNPEQAAYLRGIASGGAERFYAPANAATLVATVNGAQRNPSKMTVADVAAYRAKARPPVCGTYRGYRICGMGPPSSGGVAVLQILGQLERFDMTGLGKDSPTAWHLFAESERLAYADRDRYLGDPDFVSVPVKGLTDRAYIASRSALIAPDRTMGTVTAGTPAGAPPRKTVPASEVPGTTDVAAVDAAGNVVEVTTTIEGYFGSGLSLGGQSLNNQLTDFDFAPDKDGYLVANRVEGGKRPRSSMSPTIVYGPDGAVRLAVGAAGGSTIIAQVAKAIVGVIDWHLSAQDAIALGLLYAPGPVATAEKGTPLEPMVPALQALGERVQVAPLGLKANAIERVPGPEGPRWVGAADPRSEGVAMGTDGSVTQIVRTGQPRPAE
ncbi:MAG: gamma-glutamyltransferase family protein [Janthinobacterium lividum]